MLLPAYWLTAGAWKAGLTQPVCAVRSNMRQRGGFGRVLLDHERNTLGLEVRTTRGAELVRDLKAISGGERSFVTAAFITALAQCIAAPFYCLDEARTRGARVLGLGFTALVQCIAAVV